MRTQGREKENPKQTDSRLSTEPNIELDLTTARS